MATLTATPATFNSVWNTAIGGDTILLENGTYYSAGDNINRVNSSNITIKAKNKHQAIFDGAFLNGAAYLTIDGVKFIDYSIIMVNNTHHINILNCYLYFATGNDNMQIIGSCHHILIEDTTIFDNNATIESQHPDLIQMFQDFSTGETPSDITIRRCFLYDNPATGVIGAQGIFIKDPGPSGYRNILVEECLITCVLLNNLTIQGGVQNVIFRNNTLGSGRLWIMDAPGLGNAGVTVENNITPFILRDGNDSLVRNNFVGDLSDALINFTDGSSIDQYQQKPAILALNQGATSWWTTQAPPQGGQMADTLRITAATIGNTAWGSVVIQGTIPNQELKFTPANNFVGMANGTYTIADSANATSSATWTVTVQNPPPLAVNDVATTQKNTPVVLNVLANDYADAP